MPLNEGTTVPHPLDPLTAEEIRQAAAIVRRERGIGDGWRFASVELKDPAKDDLPALESGRLARREALVVCWDRADGRAYRGIVSLTASKVIAWDHLPGQRCRSRTATPAVTRSALTRR
jgi:primary-amine oxidase